MPVVLHLRAARRGRPRNVGTDRALSLILDGQPPACPLSPTEGARFLSAVTTGFYSPNVPVFLRTVRMASGRIAREVSSEKKKQQEVTYVRPLCALCRRCVSSSRPYLGIFLENKSGLTPTGGPDVYEPAFSGTHDVTVCPRVGSCFVSFSRRRFTRDGRFPAACMALCAVSVTWCSRSTVIEQTFLMYHRPYEYLQSSWRPSLSRRLGSFHKPPLWRPSAQFIGRC